MGITVFNDKRDYLIKFYENNGSEWFWNHYPKRDFKLFSKKRYLEETKKSGFLCGDHKNKFKKIFGKQNFCYTTWYRGWIWFLNYDGLMISITSSIRGTDYRYYNASEFTEKEIIKK